MGDYSGWSSRATFIFNEWWCKSEHLYRRLRRVCRDAIKVHEDSFLAARAVRDFLADDYERRVSRCTDPMLRDLLTEPNFLEVAEAWIQGEVEEAKE